MAVQVNQNLYIGETSYTPSGILLYRFSSWERTQCIKLSSFQTSASAAFSEVAINGEKVNGKLMVGIHYSGPQAYLRTCLQTRNTDCLPSEIRSKLEKWIKSDNVNDSGIMKETYQDQPMELVETDSFDEFEAFDLLNFEFSGLDYEEISQKDIDTVLEILQTESI